MAYSLNLNDYKAAERHSLLKNYIKFCMNHVKTLFSKETLKLWRYSNYKSSRKNGCTIKNIQFRSTYGYSSFS